MRYKTKLGGITLYGVLMQSRKKVGELQMMRTNLRILSNSAKVSGGQPLLSAYNFFRP